MSYELAIINPRGKRRRKKASAAQLAARRKFVAKYGKKRRKRKAASSTKSGVATMAKRRKSRKARSAKGRFVKKHRRSRKSKAAAAPRRRRRRSSAGKRHPAMGYTIGSRKIRRRKLNPRGRRRRYRRNPFGLPSFGGIMGQLTQAGYGAAGGIALNLALSYLPLPDVLKTGWARHATRVAGALGLGMVAKKFLGAKGNAVAAGAMTIVVYDVLKQLLGQFAPEIGGRLGEFEDVSLSGDDFYSPASYVSGYLDGDGSPGDGDVDGTGGQQEYMGAYMEGDLDGVGAYMEGDI